MSMLAVFVIVGLLYMSFDYKGDSDSRLIISSSPVNTRIIVTIANSFYNAFKQDRQSLFGSDLSDLYFLRVLLLFCYGCL